MRAKQVRWLLSVAILTFSLAAWAEPARFPKCTDPLPSVPVPSAPHGLYVVMFPGTGSHAETVQHLIHNPVVCGAVFYMIWGNVDRGPGASPRYDWSSVDDQFAPWIAAGKQVNLIVFAAGGQIYGKGGTTPEFVFSKARSLECPSFGHVPLFWDPGFKSAYREFMTAVIARYGNNPSLGYIRFGLGAGGEIFPACFHKMASDFGWNKEVWRKYLFDMLDMERDLHSPKVLTVGINPLVPPDLPWAASIADHAVADGIAIGNQSWSANDGRNFAAGRACNAGWCDWFGRYRGKVPLVLQTYQFNLIPKPDVGAAMAEGLPFAVSQGTQIFEIAINYWAIGYDPAHYLYGAHHQEYQKAFEDAAKVLGGN